MNLDQSKLEESLVWINRSTCQRIFNVSESKVDDYRTKGMMPYFECGDGTLQGAPLVSLIRHQRREHDSGRNTIEKHMTKVNPNHGYHFLTTSDLHALEGERTPSETRLTGSAKWRQRDHYRQYDSLTPPIYFPESDTTFLWGMSFGALTNKIRGPFHIEECGMDYPVDKSGRSQTISRERVRQRLEADENDLYPSTQTSGDVPEDEIDINALNTITVLQDQIVDGLIDDRFDDVKRGMKSLNSLIEAS